MIRIPNSYRPLQLNQGIAYAEYAPSNSLSGLIAFFWEIQNRANAWVRYRIIPDRTVDLISGIYGDPHLLLSVSQSLPIDMPIAPYAALWGVRLFPSVFTSLFYTPMTAIPETYWVLLSEVDRDPATARLSEQLANCGAAESKNRVFEGYVQQRLAGSALQVDLRFLEVLHQVYSSYGSITWENNRSLGLSPRHMRRLFQEYTGLSPKSFARIIRMQTALRLIRHPGFSFFDLGYCDQAHFIHEM